MVFIVEKCGYDYISSSNSEPLLNFGTTWASKVHVKLPVVPLKES